MTAALKGAQFRHLKMECSVQIVKLHETRIAPSSM